MRGNTGGGKGKIDRYTLTDTILAITFIIFLLWRI